MDIDSLAGSAAGVSVLFVRSHLVLRLRLALRSVVADSTTVASGWPLRVPW
jgi:hypothetical protein